MTCLRWDFPFSTTVLVSDASRNCSFRVYDHLFSVLFFFLFSTRKPRCTHTHVSLILRLFFFSFFLFCTLLDSLMTVLFEKTKPFCREAELSIDIDSEVAGIIELNLFDFEWISKRKHDETWKAIDGTNQNLGWRESKPMKMITNRMRLWKPTGASANGRKERNGI